MCECTISILPSFSINVQKNLHALGVCVDEVIRKKDLGINNAHVSIKVCELRKDLNHLLIIGPKGKKQLTDKAVAKRVAEIIFAQLGQKSCGVHFYSNPKTKPTKKIKKAKPEKSNVIKFPRRKPKK